MFVITGGGSGIGKALACLLAQHGRSVCIVGRREHLLVDVARNSALIDYLCTDISTPDGRKTLVEHLKSTNAIEGLVHCAGVIEPIMPLSRLTPGDWHHVLATNLDAPLFLNQSFAPQLKGGRVLHVGSGAAYFPVQGWAAYCVSKAGLSMLNRCCQLEYEDIAFTSVMPGIADTDMQKQIRGARYMAEEKRDFFQQLKRDKKLLSSETIALFMSWLLLDVDSATFAAQEWDIYDSSHHAKWLVHPHEVPLWE